MRFVFTAFDQIDLHSESQHTFNVGWSSPNSGPQGSVPPGNARSSHEYTEFKPHIHSYFIAFIKTAYFTLNRDFLYTVSNASPD